MDMFFAAVEIRDRPELKERPVAIGGPRTARGVISTANYVARKFGVRSALPTSQALKKCPELVLLPGNMRKYKEESEKVFSIFHEITPLVEGLSLDEAFLDVSEVQLFQGSATLIAEEIRRRIFLETKLTASAGVAPNKFLAKVASDQNKPDGLTVLSPDKIEEFIKELPIERIFGVGKVSAKRMHEKGFHTCGDLQTLSKTEMWQTFGKWGGSLYHYCRGEDNREVKPNRKRKSISVERTYAEDLRKHEEVEKQLEHLFPIFVDRLAKWEEKNKGELYHLGALKAKVKFADFTQTTVEKQLGEPRLDSFRTLLWEGIARQRKPIRLLGIGIQIKYPTGIAEQLDLFTKESN